MPTEEGTRGPIALRPRARIMRTLGEELISSEIVAIIELVKNSYDADASQVLIRFIGVIEQGEGTLEVADDGHGMDMETIRRAWMEPATDVPTCATMSISQKPGDGSFQSLNVRIGTSRRMDE